MALWCILCLACCCQCSSVISDISYSLLMRFCLFISYCCVCMHLVSWWLCNAVKHIICFQNVCLFVKMSVRPSHLWVTPKWSKISKYTSQPTIEDISSSLRPDFTDLQHLSFHPEQVNQGLSSVLFTVKTEPSRKRI